MPAQSASMVTLRKGAGHSKATTLKTHQGQIVTNKKGHSEDSLSLKLTEAWVSAGLPLSVLRNAKRKKVLEEGFLRSLPSAATLANEYADWAYETKLDKLIAHGLHQSTMYRNTLQP